MGTLKDVHVIARGFVDLAARTALVDGRAVRLTSIEVDLLRYLIERTGQTVSRRELMREVWGYRESVRSRTVDTCVCRLRSRLELDSRSPSHLLTVDRGYMWNAGGVRSDALSEPSNHGRQRELQVLREALDGPAHIVWVVGRPGIGKRHLLRLARRSGLFPEFGDDPAAGVCVVDASDGSSTTLAAAVQLCRTSALRSVLLSCQNLSRPSEGVVEVGPLEQAAAVNLLLARVPPTVAHPETSRRLWSLSNQLGRVPLALMVCADRLAVLSVEAVEHSLSNADLRSWADRQVGTADEHGTTSLVDAWSGWWNGLAPQVQRFVWAAALPEHWAVLGQVARVVGMTLPQAADTATLVTQAGFIALEIEPGRTRISMDEGCRAVALRLLDDQSEVAAELVRRWLQIVELDSQGVRPARPDQQARGFVLAGIVRHMHVQLPDLCAAASVMVASDLLYQGSLARAGEVLHAVDTSNLDGSASEALLDRRLELASLQGDAASARRAFLEATSISPGWRRDYWAGRVAMVEHRPRAAVSLLEGALEAADDATQPRLLLALGSALYETGDFHAAADRFETAARLSVEHGDPGAGLSAWVRLGAAHLERGDYVEARACLGEAVARRATLGDIREVGVALSNLGVVAHETGDLEQAMSLLDDAVTLLSGVQHRRFEGFARGARGLVAAERGEFRRAARDLHLARRALVEVGDATYVAVMDARLGVLSWGLGSKQAAIAHLSASAIAFQARSIRWGDDAVRAVRQRVDEGAWPDARPDSSFFRLLYRVMERAGSGELADE